MGNVRDVPVQQDRDVPVQQDRDQNQNHAKPSVAIFPEVTQKEDHEIRYSSPITTDQDGSSYQYATGIDTRKDDQVTECDEMVISDSQNLKTQLDTRASLSKHPSDKDLLSPEKDQKQHNSNGHQQEASWTPQLESFVAKQEPESLEREEVGILDHSFQKEHVEDCLQHVSPESLFQKHVIQGNGHVSLCTCSAIVSGIEGCDKQQMLYIFLNEAIKMKNENQERDFFDGTESSRCLSCLKLIILGKFPYENLTWIKASSELDNAVMCLMSYFAKLCKSRQNPGGKAYNKLIEFAPVPATSANINLHQPEIADQIKLLYSKLVKLWNQLEVDENFCALLPTGVCLLNIFNVGSCNAAQDLLPFINKYCRRALHIACYDRQSQGEALLRDFEEGLSEHYQPETYKLLKQFCSMKQNNPVVVTAIGDGEGGDELEAKIAEAVRQNIGVERVYPLCITQEKMTEAKSKFEENVIHSKFYSDESLKSILLLQKVKEKTKKNKTFWMKRSEIKSLSSLFDFENDLENFLQFFTSYGSIFYTHDVPVLKEYVITDIEQFVCKIHELYHSKEVTAKYGLFKQRADEDWRVIFEILTTLGIATEIKSSQIVKQDKLELETAMTYYYIPTSRKSPEAIQDIKRSASWSSCDTGCFSLLSCIPNECSYTKENLQACLCKHLFFNRTCFLIPTATMNNTTIRFFDDKMEEYDIEFVDDGRQLMMRLINKEQHKEAIEVKEAFGLMIASVCPFFRKKLAMSRNDLVNALQETHQKQKDRAEKRLPMKKMIKIAKHLSIQDTAKKEALLIKLGLERDWIHQTQRQEEDEWEVILTLLDDFKEEKTEEDLIEIVKEFDDDKICKILSF